MYTCGITRETRKRSCASTWCNARRQRWTLLVHNVSRRRLAYVTAKSIMHVVIGRGPALSAFGTWGPVVGGSKHGGPKCGTRGPTLTREPATKRWSMLALWVQLPDVRQYFGRCAITGDTPIEISDPGDATMSKRQWGAFGAGSQLR